MGLPTIPKLEFIHLRTFREMLKVFLLMVFKANGERYPVESLVNMLMSFQRIIRAEQKRRIARSGLHEVDFDIRKHPFFVEAKKSLAISMENSRNVGANKKRRKVDAITWEQERMMLDHPDHSISTPTGLQMHFALYFLIFLIKGNKELWLLALGGY